MTARGPQSGATLKGTMVRAGQSSERAAIYQQSGLERSGRWQPAWTGSCRHG